MSEAESGLIVGINAMRLRLGKFLYHTSAHLLASVCGLNQHVVHTSEGDISIYISPQSHQAWVLLIHGFTGRKELWLQTVLKLGKHFNYLLVDLAGHGASHVAQAQQYSFKAHAKTLKELLHKLDILQLSIVANSMGCGVAAELCRLGGLTIERSIYVSPFGLDATQMKQLQYFREGTHRPFTLASRREYEHLKQSTLVKRLWIPGSVDTYLADTYIQQAKHIDFMFDCLLASDPILDWLSATPSPIDMLVDPDDKVAKMSSVHDLPPANDKVSIVWLKDFGHLPMLESPGRLATMINKRLAAHAKRSRYID